MPEPDRIHVADPSLRFGFTQLPRPVLRARGLSDKAKLVYACLLDYAWQTGSCFPGQERLARDLDCTSRTIRSALSELREYGLVAWEQRGKTATNLYTILRLADCPNLDLASSDRQESSDHSEGNGRKISSKAGSEAVFKGDRKDSSDPDRKNPSDKYTQIQYTQGADRSTGRPGPSSLEISGDAGSIEVARRDGDAGVDGIDAGKTDDDGIGAAPEFSAPPARPLGDDEARSLSARLGLNSADVADLYDVIDEFGRRYRDRASPRRTLGRVARMFQASEQTFGGFLQLMYEARRKTDEHLRGITNRRADGRAETMGYFLTVLDELVEKRWQPPAAT